MDVIYVKKMFTKKAHLFALVVVLKIVILIKFKIHHFISENKMMISVSRSPFSRLQKGKKS